MKKAWRVLLYLLLCLMLLPLLIGGLLLIPVIQTQSVRWLSNLASEELRADVAIGSVYLKPFRTLSLDHILIKDQQLDTLLFVANLDVSISSIEFSHFALELNELKLDSAYFNLYRVANAEEMNLDFILDALKSEDTTSSDIKFKLYCNSVSINNLRFRFEDYKVARSQENQIDFSHLYISDFNTSLRNFYIEGDEIFANINDLNLAEQSGFKIDDFSTTTTISDKIIDCKFLNLKSGNTSVHGSFSMTSDSWNSYANFISEIELDGRFYDSKVDFSDIAYFSQNINGLLTPATFTGTTSGTIDNLKAKVESLSFGSSGSIKGKANIKGLPDVENMFINASLNHFYARVEDIELMKFPQNGKMLLLAVPEQIKVARFVEFKGSFVGFLYDFVAFGKVGTALGSIDADINVKSPNDTLNYSGRLASNSFDLGKLAGAQSQLGKAAFNLNVAGFGTDVKSLQVAAQGNIKHIEILGYDYRNVIVDGELKNERFNGNVSINDTNIVMDFNGAVDFTNQIPQISCKSNIGRLRLDKLNLIPEDTNGLLSVELTLDMQGRSLAGLNGTLLLSGLSYENRFRKIFVDTLSLHDRLLSNNDHQIKITSNLGEIKIDGNTSLFDLPYAFVKISEPYAPRLLSEELLMGADTNQSFSFSINLVNDTSITGLIAKDLRWEDTLSIAGSVNTFNSQFKLDLAPINWGIAGYKFENNSLSVFPRGDSLLFDFKTDKFITQSALFLENFSIKSALSNDSLGSQISWFNQTEQADSGSIDLLVHRSDSFLLNAKLNKLDVRVAGVQWRSKQKAELHADSNYIAVRDLNLRSASGFMTCNGSWSESSNEHLKFEVSNFDLAYISNFGITKLNFLGTFNGDIDMYQRNGSFVADADVNIDSLIIDGFEIGKVRGRSAYKINDRALDLDLSLNYKGNKDVRIKGDYSPFAQSDQLNLTASFKDFRATVIEPFIKDFTSEIEGNIDGEIRITGMASNPELRGDLNLQDFGLRINYLNTKYFVYDGKIRLEPDFIGMDAVTLLDENDAAAKLTLTLFHNNYSNFNYDIFVLANNFMCLNTGLAQNESYYGKALVSGDVSISGYSDLTTIDAVLKTEKGTSLSIPLSGDENVSGADFIRFVSPQKKGQSAKDQLVTNDLYGLVLNFQLELDNDAEVQLIFDEKVGDIIKVTGNGDMLMNIDNRGTFNMYGDYIVSGGDYLFTLQNIVNKRFVVEPGSRVTWSGSPYDAAIDLTAIYNLRASPYPLVASRLSEDAAANYKQRTPVDVSLRMTNTLIEPKIAFDIDLPSLQETEMPNQLLSASTTSPEEMNRQTFALLLTNSFAGGNNSGASTSSLENSGYEVLSNQFSNLISQYFDNLDVGVNYRPGDDLSANQTEVAVSTELFNDRVLLELNGKVQGDSPTETQTNNLAGEFNIEYKITKEGNLRGRVFNESNSYNPTDAIQSPYTQGVGIFYRREFDTFGEFFRDLFKNKEKRKLVKEMKKSQK